MQFFLFIKQNNLINFFSDFLIPLVVTSVGFSTGYAINEIFVKPMIKQRKIKGEILFNLTYYDNIYSNLSDFNNINKKKEASEIFRKLGSEVSSIPDLYLTKTFLYKEEELKILRDSLISLSNGILSIQPEAHSNIIQDVEKIRSILKNKNTK